MVWGALGWGLGFGFLGFLVSLRDGVLDIGIEGINFFFFFLFSFLIIRVFD